MRPHRMWPALLLAFALVLPAHAASIRFVSASGVSDGYYYIGLHTITVDNVTHLAMCYDIANSVSIGSTWQANLLTVTNLGSAYYSGQADYEQKYRAVAWLFSEMTKTSDHASQVGIQHAAWLQFAPGAPTAGAAPWLAAANVAAGSASAAVDFSTLRFIESVQGANRVQGLVVGGFPAASEVPEPSTLASVITGCVLMLAGVRHQRRKR